ncbi:MAG: TetR/AcrR family transcriptional regulator [Candidatus Dormibacteria bacterium]|jgi:AcrR family transcriptional regulator
MPASEPNRRRRAARRVRLGSQARRDAILDGAREALIHGGLDRTTMDDVAAAAGVAKGTPYLYFSSKADLIRAVRYEYGRELIARGGAVLDPELAPSEPAAQRLERFAGSIFDFAVQHRELHHVLFQDGASEGEQLAPVVVAVERFLGTAMASGELAPGNPRFLADVLVAGAHAAMLPSLHRREPDREAFLALTRDLINRLFR